MRVFVLTTGRAASKTFANACQLLDGMSVGHETKAGHVSDRLSFPYNHLEVDNRLVWFLGGIAERYSDDHTFYVYLTRAPKKVAESYLKRWHIKVSGVRAFYHGILMYSDKPEVATARQSCRLFVDTINENIRYFLKGRANWCEVRVEHLHNDFFAFMDQAGLEGDREEIAKVLGSVNNANKTKYDKVTPLKRIANRFSDRRLNL
ncbi:hypothetical protein [Marinobacter sp.]|uniref:hypothetical protein n=1 Tax=Marinobacter sp. TaxID=50741 RepID=UPI0034A26C28